MLAYDVVPAQNPAQSSGSQSARQHKPSQPTTYEDVKAGS